MRLPESEQRPVNRVFSFALVSVLVVAMSLSAIAARGDAPGAQSASASDLFSVLGDQKTNQDDTPQTQRQLVPESARRLYSGDGETYWLAKDVQGGICLIGSIDASGGPIVAMTCDETGRVALRGLSLRLTTDEGGFDATALPDGWSAPELAASIRDTGGELLGRNLLRFDPSDRPASIRLELPGRSVDLGSHGH